MGEELNGMLERQEAFAIKRTVIEGRSPHLDSISAVDLLANSYKEDPHSHSGAQLMLVDRGDVTFDVGTDRWLVPPQCALWIPAGVEHSMRSIGEVQLHCVYIESGQIELPFAQCCTVGISALLRELIIEMSKLPGRIDVNGPYARLVRTMLDQLSIAPPGPLQFAMPAHPRLREIAECWIADPADRTTIAGWARKVGMSERTLHRVLLRETGMSFGRWRRHFHIVLALRRLAEGHSVQDVAFHLGYDSSSTFVVMFRKALGKPPHKFLTDHGSGSSAEYWDYWRRDAAEVRPRVLS